MDEIEPEDRAEWRRWLADHHDASRRVWVIWRKKAAESRNVTLDDHVEEALCFGWIDTKLRPVDDERSALMFTPRRKGGTWSW